MSKPSTKDLFEFVYRADTLPKICTAERWLREHQHLTSRNVLDELIWILNQTAKALFQEQLRTEQEKMQRKEIEAV